jgi:hypothetical protein
MSEEITKVRKTFHALRLTPPESRQVRAIAAREAETVQHVLRQMVKKGLREDRCSANDDGGESK